MRCCARFSAPRRPCAARAASYLRVHPAARVHVGRSRAKWVAAEHTRALTSHFDLHAVAIDYRGFADSAGGGAPTPERLVDDAMGAVEWLGARGVPPSRLVLYGHSLGSGPWTWVDVSNPVSPSGSYVSPMSPNEP